MIEELISRVFATRDAAHLAHWRTKSYAQHSALGEFYDGLIDRIDGVVETLQGADGLIGDVTPTSVKTENITAHIKEEGEWIEANLKELSGGYATVENMLQDLAGLYFKTVYKLTNLK